MEAHELLHKPIDDCQYSTYMSGYRTAQPTFDKLPAGMYQPKCQDESEVKIPGHSGGDVYYAEPKSVEVDELICFGDSIVDTILNNVKSFWDAEAQYAKLNLIHKRGIFLHGVPGGGKTSIVGLVARRMIENGDVVFYNNYLGYTISFLQKFRKVEPLRRAALIIEDVDDLAKSHDSQRLLSLLDGELSINHLIVLATSNYPEDMEKRLLNRPGRFDEVIAVNVVDENIREQYFVKKLGAKIHNGIDLVEVTKGLPMSHIKEFLVQVAIHGKNAMEVAKKLKEMKKTPKSDQTTGVGFGLADDDDS